MQNTYRYLGSLQTTPRGRHIRQGNLFFSVRRKLGSESLSHSKRARTGPSGSISCLYHFGVQILPWERVWTCNSPSFPERLDCLATSDPHSAPPGVGRWHLSAYLESRKRCNWSLCCLCPPAQAESLRWAGWYFTWGDSISPATSF